MALFLDAACMCSVGKVRKNNEDNFFFDNRCLPEVNSGLRNPAVLRTALLKELCVAVFDGMGGANFGESAAFAAAECLKRQTWRLTDFFIPEKRFLRDLCVKANEAVAEKKKELQTEQMGTTMAALYFTHRYVYVCNLGDSRAYRLRDGEFLQLSQDHVAPRENGERKSPLTQYLGIDPEEYRLEPFVAKGELHGGDRFLLCSDGLTDMLTNAEIDGIMETTPDRKRTEAALAAGGRDNVTVIVCAITQRTT